MIVMPEADANQIFDQRLADAISLLLGENPELLDPAAGSSLRLRAETLTGHIQQMVRGVDTQDPRKLRVPTLARASQISGPVVRGVLGRHPLIPRILPVRAALELSSGASGPPLTGIIKVYAGLADTRTTIRGVHRAQPSAEIGRQLHLELVVITEKGRAVLVNTERFAVGDVTWEAARKAGQDAIVEARSGGVTARRVLEDRWNAAIAGFYRQTWGMHVMDVPPRTVSEHVKVLVEGAIHAADLAGAKGLYEGLPVVGGQLVAGTRFGALPADPTVSLLGHDLPSLEQLIELGTVPTLDLNLGDGSNSAINELPYKVKLPRRGGVPAGHGGVELLAVASDPNWAQVVPRDQLGVRAPLRLAVTYVDGEVDFPAGPRAVRVFFRAGLAVPHNMYIVPMVPGDIRTHQRALAAIVGDSTEFYGRRGAPMVLLQSATERKGAFDPGGERAAPTECLATIARLAADRELHRVHLAR